MTVRQAWFWSYAAAHARDASQGALCEQCCAHSYLAYMPASVVLLLLRRPVDLQRTLLPPRLRLLLLPLLPLLLLLSAGHSDLCCARVGHGIMSPCLSFATTLPAQ
jgi:hypothetical protein